MKLPGPLRTTSLSRYDTKFTFQYGLHHQRLRHQRTGGSTGVRMTGPKIGLGDLKLKNSKLEIQQVGAKLGAVIQNIDLTAELTEEEMKTLRRALDDHQVIFFPDQELNPTQQKDATKIFGPLMPSETFFDHLDDDPEIEILINDKNNPPVGTALWHADLTWAKEPPGGTSLYSRVIPKGGKGNTLWHTMDEMF